MSRWSTPGLGILAMLLCSCMTLADSALPEVRIGVLAKRGRERCLEKWAPTANYLGARVSGRHFRIVPLDFEQIDDAVEAKAIDFVLVNSAIYVRLEHLYHVNRVVTLKALHGEEVLTMFGGVILMRKDSGVAPLLENLKGKRFAAVKENSFGGWLMACRELRVNGIDPERDFESLTFSGTHDQVVYDVLEGKADAGTVRTDTLEHMASEGKISLDDIQVFETNESRAAHFPFLCSTQLYPEWPLAKLIDTPDELAERVSIALLQMPPDSEAARSAACAGWTIPLNYQNVHDCLRYLRVSPYEDFGKVTIAGIWRQFRGWILVTLALLLAILVFAGVAFVLNRRLKEQLHRREVAERELEVNRQFLQTLIDHLPVAVFTIEPATFRLTSWNPMCELQFGRQREDVVGHTLAEVFGDNADALLRPDECSTIEQQRVLSVAEQRLACADKAECVLQLRKAGVFDQSGRLDYVTVIVEDITEQRASEDAIRKARDQEALQRGKIEMASNVLHDIGNATTGLATIATTLLGDTDWGELDQLRKLVAMFEAQKGSFADAIGPGKTEQLILFVGKLASCIDKRRQTFQGQLETIANLTSHVNQILSLQRRYAVEKGAFQRGDVDVAKIIDDALEMVSGSLGKREIGVTRRYGTPCRVAGDRTRLLQVFMNVFKNAYEAFDGSSLEEGRELEVSIDASDEGMAVVSIRDNATGFAPDLAEQLFEKGYSSKNRDSGLGLSQCRSIVDSHGGTMTMCSEGVGKGATTTIQIPLKDHRRKETPDV